MHASSLDKNRDLQAVPLTMYGPNEGTGSVKNYNEAVAFCVSKGKKLASKSDYCDGGDGSNPYGGVKKGADEWAPTGDTDNSWIQLGDAHHPTCSTHDAWGPPAWGTDNTKENWEANYILCKQAVPLTMYGPNEGTGSVKNYNEAVASVFPSPRPGTSQQVFSQCAGPYSQQGIFPPELDPFLGCIDSFGTTFDLLKDLIALISGGDEVLNAIVNEMLQPVEKVVEILMSKLNDHEELSKQGWGVPQVRVCAGDFDAADITDPPDDLYMVERCGDLPLATRNSAEWSVFAIHVDLPAGLSGSVCEGLANAVTIDACFAISTCDVLPSVAFTMGSGILSCLTAQAGVETSGITTVISYALEAGLNFMGWGLSLTNAFEVSIPLYNGFELFDYAASPTIFDRYSLAIDSGKLHDALDGYFELSGTMTRGISIFANGRPADEATTRAGIASFEAKKQAGDNPNNYTDPDGDIINQFANDLTLQAVVQGKIDFTVAMSNIPYIGSFLEDFTIQVAQANAFISTGQQDVILPGGTEKTVHGGIYFFLGNSGAASAIKEFLDSTFTSIKGMLVSARYYCWGVVSLNALSQLKFTTNL